MSRSSLAYHTSSSGHLGEFGHLRAIRAYHLSRYRPASASGQAVVPAGDHEARRETLYVPLPGRGQRLIEVIDVEDDVALGRGEPAEVDQVAVAASLDS